MRYLCYDYFTYLLEKNDGLIKKMDKVDLRIDDYSFRKILLFFYYCADIACIGGYGLLLYILAFFFTSHIEWTTDGLYIDASLLVVRKV